MLNKQRSTQLTVSALVLLVLCSLGGNIAYAQGGGVPAHQNDAMTYASSADQCHDILPVAREYVDTEFKEPNRALGCDGSALLMNKLWIRQPQADRAIH